MTSPRRQVSTAVVVMKATLFHIADTTLGIPFRYEPVDVTTFGRALAVQGATPFLIQHLSNVAQDYRDGIFAGAESLVEAITGRAAMTVEELTNANREAFERPGQEASWEELRGGAAH
jgi:NAD(P)H dehydrogenase (quinone)